MRPGPAPTRRRPRTRRARGARLSGSPLRAGSPPAGSCRGACSRGSARSPAAHGGSRRSSWAGARLVEAVEQAPVVEELDVGVVQALRDSGHRGDLDVGTYGWILLVPDEIT